MEKNSRLNVTDAARELIDKLDKLISNEDMLDDLEIAEQINAFKRELNSFKDDLYRLARDVGDIRATLFRVEETEKDILRLINPILMKSVK